MLRGVIALAVAAVTAGAAIQLARVDTTLGDAFGPDRMMRRIDVSPSASAPTDARAVLASRPIDGRAYRVLALAEKRDDLLVTANARWPRDAMTLATLTDRALAVGQVDAGLEHFDALLRTQPGTRSLMLPLLMPYLGDARVRDALVDRLAQDPPWRDVLFAALRTDAAPALEAEALLVSLGNRVPPDDEALQTRIAVLDRAGRAAEARALWLQSIDARDAGLVFDGGFEHPVEAKSPYAWRFDDVPGAVIDYATDETHSGASALSIEFEDRAVRFASVHQALALAPGQYRLEAAALDRVESIRPFEWRLACKEGGEIARLPLARTREWNVKSVTFEVSPECGGQTLSLVHAARSLPERRLRGRLSIDDVGIFLSAPR